LLGYTGTQQPEIAGIMGNDNRGAVRGIMELIGITRADHTAFQCGIRIKTTQSKPYSETNMDAFIEVDEGLRHY
jgi:hypothetical protein